MNISGLNTWDDDDKKDAKALLLEYSSIFAKDNMKLGKTSVVKHSIELSALYILKRGIDESLLIYIIKLEMIPRKC